ncbi:dTDP-4-dehydrorhamnose reductase [Cytobacillus firmus]|uniref:dTDP-4-dehydrorhamnose reductase n=1 Tax=Cytobacillus firmus TaxID=1399 RepID=A0A800MRT5_CYTFI|nr:dTDP-4-dehydrorhamnose reductase [Cytobacillus firmus]KAF0821278.1 dTDP-4-dehydrorhamnose reductase [Cytobacillus firmus]
MKILITGAHGQLGQQLKRKLSETHFVVCQGKKELDITHKEEAEERIIHINPEIIIHAAAYTAVDQCEIQKKKAFEVNGIGAGYIAQAASKIGARVIYISSDYVFDGKKQSPYTEKDETNPQSIYGMSKWLGEKLVMEFNNGTIIRTSWLYGHEGNNFVKKMIELGKKGRDIKVVSDQIGSPTYVNDLVETMIHLLDKSSGTYHISNTGSCSWYEFAKCIFNEAGFNPDLIHPTTTKDYGALAPRPCNSILEHTALKYVNIPSPRKWDIALREFIRKELIK